MTGEGQEVTLSGAPDGQGLVVGEVPAAGALLAFSQAAARDGRQLVVGAIVTDGGGRVFVQRRSPSRELFPGAWDMVGGHAEPGEDALTALRRELHEETGWELATLGPVVELIDWEANGVARREVDVVVTVTGDLAGPVLEADKHDDWRWVGRGDTAVLDEGRAPQDVWLRGVIERALDLLERTGFGS
ncbi:MAG TPA: NUDIX domain-containing protein [Trueperaceae bacterium]|nr:NUDIX domain-containing protein [Trueperaceae bacterium]